MSLKRKDLEVLNLIMEKKSLEEIYLKLETSERNLRYILDNLNFYLKKLLNKTIEKNRGKLLLHLSSEDLEEFLKNVYQGYYVPEQEERVEYILISFLFLKNVKLNFLENSLEVTRATLKKDIHTLNLLLKDYDLQLEVHKNKFTITGNEKKFRHLKTLKYLEYIDKNKNDWIDTKKIFQPLDTEELYKLRTLVLQIEESFSLNFGEEFITLMEVFLCISLERIEEKNIINRKINYDFLIKTKYYSIIKNTLKNHIPETLTYELAHLTEYFISGGVKENLKELQESIEKYSSELIFSIFQNSDYKELKSKINEYLIPAIYRLKNNFTLGSIGEKSETYYLVETFSKNENFLPEKLGENEIFYISKEIDKEKTKIISLKLLLDIIDRNSCNLNREALIRDIIVLYGDSIKIDI